MTLELDDTGICPGSTAQDRFQEWAEADLFLRFWQAGVEQFDELKGIDWSGMSMDGAMTKGPLGGKKSGPILLIAAKPRSNTVC